MQGENWETAVRKFLESNGYEVVEIRSEKRSRFIILKVFIDKDGGVTLDDCAETARMLNNYISQQNFITREYRLEVSSPGLDRALKSERDFSRKINRRIRVIVRDGDETEPVEGTLTAVAGGRLTIEGKKRPVIVPLDKIVMGKVILPW